MVLRRGKATYSPYTDPFSLGLKRSGPRFVSHLTKDRRFPTVLYRNYM